MPHAVDFGISSRTLIPVRKLWIDLRSSLWFVPTLLVLLGITLAVGLVEIDARFSDDLKNWGWLPFLKAGAAGARGMLEAIASSMITVAGLAFSITIVTLSLASTQYSPRILRNFMRDRANQSVLGVFVGIYAYCLIVLRTIRDANDNGGGFVPLLAVSFGVLLALVGIGYLIFFIHHIATSIQASSILDSITTETIKTIDKLFPSELGEPAEDRPAAAEEAGGKEWFVTNARTTGYIQSVAAEALWSFATDHQVVLKLIREVGDFVVTGEPLVSSSKNLEVDWASRLDEFFVIGSFRTVDQDVSFGIRQIVDIALKALSPGINGTTTAVACLDYLGAILSRLAERPMPSPYRKGEGQLVVIAPNPDFADFLGKSLDEIRLCAADNVTIYLSQLALVARVARKTSDPLRQSSLLLHAKLIAGQADGSVPIPYDRERINAGIENLRKAFASKVELPDLAHRPAKEIVRHTL
jgi:uncharacterized membrane protein